MGFPERLWISCITKSLDSLCSFVVLASHCLFLSLTEVASPATREALLINWCQVCSRSSRSSLQKKWRRELHPGLKIDL